MFIKSAIVYIMIWHLKGGKPLSKQMMTDFRGKGTENCKWKLTSKQDPSLTVLKLN